MVKTLYLVRHAHYRIPHPRTYQESDLGGTVLTVKGIEDIIALAHKLRHDDRDIKMIYSSPYQRATETAQLLAKILRADIEIRDNIQENHVGAGEKDHLKLVYTKFKETIEEALNYSEGNCVLVSHRFPISLFISRESGLSYENIGADKEHTSLIKMGGCFKLLFNGADMIKYEKI